MVSLSKNEKVVKAVLFTSNDNFFEVKVSAVKNRLTIGRQIEHQNLFVKEATKTFSTIMKYCDDQDGNISTLVRQIKEEINKFQAINDDHIKLKKRMR